MTSSVKKPGLKLVGEPTKPPVEKLQRPCFAVYTADTVVEGRTLSAGTWMHGVEFKQGEGIPVDRRICDPLHIVADTLSTEDNSYGLLVAFTTPSKPGHPGRHVELFVPRADLAGRGEAVIKQLMGYGLAFSGPNQSLLPRYLLEHTTDKLIETTSKTGWHRSGAFVLPQKTIGPQGALYRAPAAANPFTQKGSIESWQKHIGSFCQGNPVLIVSVCCALAGPLLEKTLVHGGGLHLIGRSSSGKSLAQLIAASVWGEPKRMAGSWDVTKPGMEISASSRNDTVLILDEISRVNPKILTELVYLIANGGGKATMTIERTAREVITWRVLALSSGEASLSDHARSGGQHSQAGAELRMIDIDAGNRTYRAFDDVHGMEPGQFHGKLTQASKQHHGHLGPAFVEQLLQGARLADLQQQFRIMQVSFATEGAQSGRIADRFAVMALAGELATEWGLTGWPDGTALEACRLLFEEWLAEAGSGNLEDRQILQAVREYIEKYAESRFSEIMRADQPGQPMVAQRSGYYRSDQLDGRQYLFFPSGIREAAPNHNIRQIISALSEAGALAETDTGKTSKTVRVPGDRTQRFYIVDPDKLYPNETTGIAP